MKPEELQADFTPRLEQVDVKAPPPRKGGAKVRPSPSLALLLPRADADSRSSCAQVESVDEVVAKLKEAGVL